MKVEINIFNPQRTMSRILDDNVGIFMSTTCARYMDKYTPMQRGMLLENKTLLPFKVVYNSPYAHYIHEGNAMVGPNGSAWAKLGETKHYSGKKLEFSKEQNTFARSHWEESVQKNSRVKIAKEVTEYINR